VREICPETKRRRRKKPTEPKLFDDTPLLSKDI